MRLLALIVPLAYWPWWGEPGHTIKWIALWLGVPLILLVTRVNWRLVALPLAWLAYAGISIAWGPHIDGALAWWNYAIIVGVLAIGTAVPIRQACILYAYAVGVSGFLAIAQIQGWIWLPTVGGAGGLFVNKNYLAEAGLLAVAASLIYRQWWALPGALAAALLPQSRLILASAGLLGIWWVWGKSRFLAVCLILATLSGALYVAERTRADLKQLPATNLWSCQPCAGLYESMRQRASLWKDTVSALRIEGHGVGSYMAAYPTMATDAPREMFSIWTQPDHPHNDILLLVFETGIAALLLLIPIGLCLWVPADERWMLRAFVLAGLAAFPLSNPATAFIAALVAGHLLRVRHEPVVSGHGRRDALYGRRAQPDAFGNPPQRHPGCVGLPNGQNPQRERRDSQPGGQAAPSSRIDRTEASARGAAE